MGQVRLYIYEVHCCLAKSKSYQITNMKSITKRTGASLPFSLDLDGSKTLGVELVAFPLLKFSNVDFSLRRLYIQKQSPNASTRRIKNPPIATQTTFLLIKDFGFPEECCFSGGGCPNT